MTNVRSALVINTLMALGTAAMIYLGTLHVLDGILTLGHLTVFLGYLAMLYAPIEALTQTAWALEGAAAGAQRCFEVLDHADDVRDAPDAAAITATVGAIRFRRRGVWLRGGAPHLAARQPGPVSRRTRGLRRRHRARAKSTLLSLVPRFYDPTAGHVLLDERDLRTLTKKSLRAQISLVLQDTLLFSTSIRENIAYGRPDATDAEITEAAERAQALDFIRNLAAWLRQPGGRAWRAPERRAAPAHRHRTRVPEKLAHPPAR